MLRGFDARQPYSLVIIGEKSSLADVLLPIAQRFEADLYLPTGEISNTLIYQIASDAASDGRPLRVFYASDFDPTGYEMVANCGRKLQAFRDLEFPDLDFECRQIALTFEQVRDLGLPSTPLKPTERRGDRWRAHWGQEQTEIDALATLQPDVLRRIARAAIAPFFDNGLDHRCLLAQRDWHEEAQRILDEQLDHHRLSELHARADALLSEAQREIAEINDEVRDLTDVEIDLPLIEVPDAEIDSGRAGGVHRDARGRSGVVPGCCSRRWW